jgi:ESCRT-I complex subunit VPS28
MSTLLPVPPLFEDRQERDRQDDLATFYSIIKATELLERAYMNDSVGDEEYTAECSKLIGKFKNMERTLIAGNIIASTEAFMTRYHLADCRKARECLLTRGVPLTVLYRHAPSDASGAGAAIAETTSALITCLDGLNLGNHAVDEVQPALKDVLDCLNKVAL